MDKEELQSYLEQGLSTREIEKVVGLDHRTISYWINKHGLRSFQKYKKEPNYKFGEIDTPEKAYVLGFILSDGSISNDSCELSVSLADKEVVDFVSSVIGGTVRIDLSYDKERRRFPRARLIKKITDITRFVGGSKKADRHYPRIRKDLRRYLLQGFFEGDGCITWGHRKDRDRLWHKVTMKSSLNIMCGLQNELINEMSISSKIYPVKNENAYCIEFANKTDVLKFLDYVYPDDSFIVLNRKYLKQIALRLELGENGERCA